MANLQESESGPKRSIIKIFTINWTDGQRDHDQVVKSRYQCIQDIEHERILFADQRTDGADFNRRISPSSAFSAADVKRINRGKQRYLPISRLCSGKRGAGI